MLWQAFWDGERGFYCLLSFKRVNRCDGFVQLFGAVIENKQTLPAGSKFIDDLHRSRWRQIAETLVDASNIRQDSHAMQWGEVNFGWRAYELVAGLDGCGTQVQAA
jgi:hypothetical protein